LFTLNDYLSNPEEVRNQLLDKIERKVSIQTKSFTDELQEKIKTDYKEDDFKKALARFIHNDTQKICPYGGCDKERKFISVAKGFSKGCGKKHSTILTNLEKYGVENPKQAEEVKEKTRKTCLEKYGVDNPAKAEIVKQKAKESYKSKTGYNSPLENPDVVEKIKETNIRKYGVDNPLKNEEINKKAKQTLKERYGVDVPIHNQEIREKIHQTNLERYGVKYPAQSLEYRKRKKGEYFEMKFQSENSRIKPMFTKDYYVEKILNDSKFKFRWKCKGCGFEFEAHNHNAVMPRCPKCYPVKFKGYSKAEKEVASFIKQFVSVIENDRTILGNGKELDIVIPSKKIAVEFNGLYWHSELNGKDRDYHIGKTKLAEEKGYQLIHIFEDEWIEKQEIVKSIIKAKLGIFDKRIYARKTIIREITTKEKDEFLEENHIQGKDSSSIRLGLFYNDELVSVMTFGKPRFNKNYQYEMHRFCSKKGYQIIGGASKLFKYFIRNYNPESIITYADIRYSKGETYPKLGFELLYESKPAHWVIEEYEIRHNRMKFQKHKQKDILETFIPEFTAWENLQINNYDRMWDCGNYVFEWKKENK